MINVNNLDSPGNQIAFRARDVNLVTEKDYGSCIHLQITHQKQLENIIRTDVKFELLLSFIHNEESQND